MSHIVDRSGSFKSTTVLSDWHHEFTVPLLSVRTASLCVLALAQVSNADTKKRVAVFQNLKEIKHP